MTDDSVSPPPRKGLKRILLLVGIPVAVLAVTVGLVTGLIIKIDKFHGAWCKNVGVFCVKEPPKVVVIVPPAGCPQGRMTGAMTPRRADDPAWNMTADVIGRVSIDREGESASGQSNVACFGGSFLATFLDMSDGLTYQCLGSVTGESYAGTCNRSIGGSEQIAGNFVK